MDDFVGRAALVTGAGSGIGRASAAALARRGASVLVCDVDESGGAETVDLIKADGGNAEFRRVDVSDPGDVEDMVAHAVETFGRLDFAHNNAGVSGETALTADYPLEMWNKVIGVNLTGMFLCMKYELRHMDKVGRGVITNTTSDSGLRATPGVAGYISSKHGAIGLTKTAALEYASKGIRINSVCPGLIQTPMTQHYLDEGLLPDGFIASKVPVGRLGQPEEIAALVVWLFSDEASYMNGASIPVDGAMNEA